MADSETPGKGEGGSSRKLAVLLFVVGALVLIFGRCGLLG